MRVLRGFAGVWRSRPWHFGALGGRVSASCLGNGVGNAMLTRFVGSANFALPPLSWTLLESAKTCYMRVPRWQQDTEDNSVKNSRQKQFASVNSEIEASQESPWILALPTAFCTADSRPPRPNPPKPRPPPFRRGTR